MRAAHVLPGLVAAMIGFGATLVPQKAQAAPAAILDDLNAIAFLAGDWAAESVDANGRSHSIEAHYLAPKGGLSLGDTRFVDAEQISFFEFETFTVKDGAVILAPSPFGTPGVTFALTQASENFVHFENLAHTFPRVIEYRLNDDGTLYSKAEGVDASGQPEIFEYTQKLIAP